MYRTAVFFLLGVLLVCNACHRPTATTPGNDLPTKNQPSTDDPPPAEQNDSVHAVDSSNRSNTENGIVTKQSKVDSVTSLKNNSEASPTTNIGSTPADEPDSLGMPESADDKTVADENGGPLQPLEHDAERPPANRIIALTDFGPIVIDVRIYIDGQTFHNRVDQLIDRVLKLGDTDKNDETTWKELMSSRHFVYGQFGNPPIESEQQRIELQRVYDINRNKIVDREEVLGFLRQDASNARSFYLSENSLDRDADDPVFQWLDANDNDAIDESEMQLAAVRMWKNDTNDDEILSLFELANREPNTRPNRSPRRSGRTFLVLHEYSDWSRLLYALEEKYSFGNPLSANDLPEPTGFFAQLDSDHDDYLSPEEFAHVAKIDPHVEIVIHFGVRASSGLGATGAQDDGTESNRPNDDTNSPQNRLSPINSRLIVEHLQPTLPVTSVSVTEDRMELKFAGCLIDFVIRDFTGMGLEQRVCAVFAQADQNDDGEITENELPAVVGITPNSVTAIDADQDGKITKEEFRQSLVNREAAQRDRIDGVASAGRRDLFRLFDTNGDSQLSLREMDQIIDKLEALDSNQDGQVTQQELPNTLTITLRRGDPNPADEAPVAAIETSANQQPDMPKWFTSMDVNRDGEISRREFLGPPNMFHDMDANHDGFLSINEVR